jgi:hypothetical protein
MGYFSKRPDKLRRTRLETVDAIDELLWSSRCSVMNHALELRDRAGLSQHSARRVRRWWIGGCVAAGVALVSGFTAPQWLHIGKDFNLLTSTLSPDDVRLPTLQGYGQPVNQSITRHGITLTIGNIYADPLRFEFDMVESFDQSAPSRPVLQDGDIQMDIDGTRPIVGFSGGEFRPADGGRYAGVVYMPMTNMQPFQPLPLQFTLHVHIQRIGNVEGPWDFSIPVSREKMAEVTRVIRPGVAATDGQTTFVVDEIDLEPNETVIEAVMTFPDDAGQIPGDGFNPDGFTSVVLTDENGRRISGGRIVGWSPAGSRDGKNAYLATIEAQKVPKDASTVFITPLRQKQATSIALSKSAPVHVDTAFGPVTVHPPEFLPDRTVVQVEGNFATYRGQPMQVFSMWWKDANGMYGCPEPKVTQDSSTSTRWTLVFPKLDENRQYQLGIIRFVPAAKLEVRVPLAGRVR